MTLSGIAKRVHDEILSLPDEAAVQYVRMVVAGALQHDLEVHRDLFQHRVDQVVAKRVARVKEGVVRSYVSKRMGGAEVDHLHALAAVISKAGFDFTEAERRRYAERQQRDASGRFRTMNRNIDYSRAEKKLPGRYAARLGVPEQAKNLDGKDRARYQHAYLQVADMVRQFDDMPPGEATLSLVYSDGRRVSADLPKVNQLTTSEDKLLDPNKFYEGGRLVSAQVVTDAGLSVRGAGFDLMGALGASPYVAGRASSALKQTDGQYDGASGLGSFATDWNQTMDEDAENPANRIYRRFGAGSRLLSEIAGDNAPEKVKLALQAGELVAQYGPEAQRVIGPHADRAAYRYRGVERAPDPGLQSMIDNATARLGAEGGRNELIYGTRTPGATRPGQQAGEDFVPSKLVSYFQQRLPKQELTHLQRKSGVIPPSEGIIIDRRGKVVTQAVGYGDDWYLPFNLKTLGKLKGGEYVRTRTWGGPTTEDIYTGLMSGARSVTVVSHNGTYTVEFDDSLRGSRRYNDKAARMVKRYGHLLDAAKSQQVTADIPPERKKEIYDEAAAVWDPKDRTERDRFKAKYEELLEDEHQDPTMPQSMKDALAEEFLAREASKLATADGYASDWTALAQDHVRRQVAESRAFHSTFTPDLEFNEAEATAVAMSAVDSPEKVIARRGLQAKYDAFLEGAEKKYKAEHSPLRLDGEGYHQSMRALQEQFPYYVSSVRYTPNERGGFDWGYVKPRFNRPEGAEAGYFDPTITGSGKRTADRTRFQNLEARRRGDAWAKDQKTKETERSATATARASGGTAAPTRGAARDPKEAQRAALKALYEEVAGAKNYAAGPGAPGQGGTINRAAISPHIKADLDPFFTMSWADHLEELEADEKYADRFLDMVRNVKAKRIIDVPETKIRAAAQPGQSGRKFSVEVAREAPDRDFDFGTGFEPDRDPEQYQRMINRLIKEMKVEPDVDLDAYVKREGELLDIARSGRSATIRPQHAGRHEKNIERAVQVKQLLRLQEDSSKKRAALAEAERRAEEDAKPKVEFWNVDAETQLGQAMSQQSNAANAIKGALADEDDEKK